MATNTRLICWPQYWSFQQRFLCGFLGCAGVMSYAVYTQYFGGLMPCPLCTFQRGAFVLLGAVFVLGAMHNPRRKCVRSGYVSITILIAFIGMAIAARHVWIQQLPAELVPACGPDLGYMLHSWPITETLREAFTGSGQCAVIDWTMFGLSMPAWSLITFAALAAWSATSLINNTHVAPKS